MRRWRRIDRARPALREAGLLFAALGAGSWQERARIELLATGERRAIDPAVSALDQLSPQEQQVARLVAGGLSNAETAAATFITTKTVEAHLTRIYRKLSLRSRTELARTMLRQGLIS